MLKTTDRSYQTGYRTRTTDAFGVSTYGQDDRVYRYSATRTTENSVGWRQRIKLGLNATGYLNGTDVVVTKSPASSTKVTKVPFGSGYIRQYYDGDPLWLDPYYPGAVATPHAVSADAVALGEFVSRIRSAQTKVQSLVVAGEMGKTCIALANSGKQLQTGVFAFVWDSYRKLKREPPATLRKHWVSIVSDLWLTYVYGIQPTLQDIKGLAEAGAQNDAAQNPRIFVQGKGKSSTFTGVSTHNITLNGCNVLATSRRQAFADCRYFGVVRASIPNTANMAQSLYGYDWSNVVPSLWELIPYSFLADYFTNIGDILSAWSLCQATVGWVSRTSRYGGLNKVTDSHDVTLKGPDDFSSYAPFTIQVETRTVDRRALSSVPTPDLVFSLPGPKQWVNMAALAATHDEALNELR